MAPRVIKGGKIIIGVSGGEYAVRGFFSAYDADTGKLAWRFYTVPGDPSKPFEHPDLAAAAKTWSNEWWKIGGGGAVWNGFAYDGDNDIVYVGTGQPGPWTDMHRGAGDNLYTTSIVAVRGATGKLVWYYQEVPGDDWDYDSIADLMLLDLRINGRNRKVIIHAPKDAFFYVLDRLTGEVISADPITKVSWATGIDPKTGKPIVNPAARYRTTAVTVMPGPSGGHVWQPWTYSPMTGLVYFPGAAGGSYVYRADPDFVATSTDIGPTGRGPHEHGDLLRVEAAVADAERACVAAERGAVMRPTRTRFLPKSQRPTRRQRLLRHPHRPSRLRLWRRSDRMDRPAMFSMLGIPSPAKNDGALQVEARGIRRWQSCDGR
jgi:PQQ-dependent dehydrogenase (methanol/ethanol family)